LCLSHSLLGSLLQEDGATWFNPDAFTRQWVEQGWALDEANAQAWQEGVRRLRRAMDEGHDYAFETTLGAQTIPRLLLDACAQHRNRGVVLRLVERGAAFATRRGASGRRWPCHCRAQDPRAL
jgi:predicted ABC-type ATPase